MRESEIEKKVSDYARAKGWLVYKFVSPSQCGVPDKIFIRGGEIFFIEFKAPGKKPTELQNKIFSKIQNELFEVHIIDDIAQGKKLIDGFNW